jgi:hypothetical protein
LPRGPNTNDLAGGTQRIAAETRSYYLLGYDATKEPDGRFRKIRVKVNRKGTRAVAVGQRAEPLTTLGLRCCPEPSHSGHRP